MVPFLLKRRIPALEAVRMVYWITFFVSSTNKQVNGTMDIDDNQAPPQPTEQKMDTHEIKRLESAYLKSLLASLFFSVLGVGGVLLLITFAKELKAEGLFSQILFWSIVLFILGVGVYGLTFEGIRLILDKQGKSKHILLGTITSSTVVKREPPQGSGFFEDLFAAIFYFSFFGEDKVSYVEFMVNDELTFKESDKSLHDSIRVGRQVELHLAPRSKFLLKMVRPGSKVTQDPKKRKKGARKKNKGRYRRQFPLK